MADENNDIGKRPPDPFVAARINNPGEPAPPTLQLSGLLGDSDRAGYRRLYLNTRLDYYVEFRVADVLATESIVPEAAPFVGLDSTRVTLSREASVDYVRSRRAAGGDDFSVAAAGTSRTAGGPFPTVEGDFTILQSAGGTCGFCDPSLWGPCVPETWLSCQFTCDGRICETVNGTCISCFNTCGGTCVTCGQATCNTCGQNTCNTCGQDTCITCGGTRCITHGGSCLVICQTDVATACFPRTRVCEVLEPQVPIRTVACTTGGCTTDTFGRTGDLRTAGCGVR